MEDAVQIANRHLHSATVAMHRPVQLLRGIRPLLPRRHFVQWVRAVQVPCLHDIIITGLVTVLVTGALICAAGPVTAATASSGSAARGMATSPALAPASWFAPAGALLGLLVVVKFGLLVR